jgi:hypothetical protein
VPLRPVESSLENVNLGEESSEPLPRKIIFPTGWIAKTLSLPAVLLIGGYFQNMNRERHDVVAQSVTCWTVIEDTTKIGRRHDNAIKGPTEREPVIVL